MAKTCTTCLYASSNNTNLCLHKNKVKSHLGNKKCKYWRPKRKPEDKLSLRLKALIGKGGKQ